MILCDYGCNQEAKFQLKNKKWCCEKNRNCCLEIRRKNSIKLKEAYASGRKKSAFIEYNKINPKNKSGWKHKKETIEYLRIVNKRKYGDNFKKKRSEDMFKRYANGKVNVVGRLNWIMRAR